MDERLREWLLARDGGCVARYANSPFWRTRWPMLQGLPPFDGSCRSRWGELVDAHDRRHMTIEEVKLESRLGVKAGYSPQTSVVMCWGHHVFGRQWCTSAVVRAAIRQYIVAANARTAPY